MDAAVLTEPARPDGKESDWVDLWC